MLTVLFTTCLSSVVKFCCDCPAYVGLKTSSMSIVYVLSRWLEHWGSRGGSFRVRAPHVIEELGFCLCLPMSETSVSSDSLCCGVFHLRSFSRPACCLASVNAAATELFVSSEPCLAPLPPFVAPVNSPNCDATGGRFVETLVLAFADLGPSECNYSSYV